VKRQKKCYLVTVTFDDGHTREELIEALDYKAAERMIKREVRGAKSVRARLVLG